MQRPHPSSTGAPGPVQRANFNNAFPASKAHSSFPRSKTPQPPLHSQRTTQSILQTPYPGTMPGTGGTTFSRQPNKGVIDSHSKRNESPINPNGVKPNRQSHNMAMKTDVDAASKNGAGNNAGNGSRGRNESTTAQPISRQDDGVPQLSMVVPQCGIFHRDRQTGQKPPRLPSLQASEAQVHQEQSIKEETRHKMTIEHSPSPESSSKVSGYDRKHAASPTHIVGRRLTQSLANVQYSDVTTESVGKQIIADHNNREYPASKQNGRFRASSYRDGAQAVHDVPDAPDLALHAPGSRQQDTYAQNIGHGRYRNCPPQYNSAVDGDKWATNPANLTLENGHFPHQPSGFRNHFCPFGSPTSILNTTADYIDINQQPQHEGFFEHAEAHAQEQLYQNGQSLQAHFGYKDMELEQYDMQGRWHGDANAESHTAFGEEQPPFGDVPRFALVQRRPPKAPFARAKGFKDPADLVGLVKMLDIKEDCQKRAGNLTDKITWDAPTDFMNKQAKLDDKLKELFYHHQKSLDQLLAVNDHVLRQKKIRTKSYAAVLDDLRSHTAGLQNTTKHYVSVGAAKKRKMRG